MVIFALFLVSLVCRLASAQPVARSAPSERHPKSFKFASTDGLDIVQDDIVCRIDNYLPSTLNFVNGTVNGQMIYAAPEVKSNTEDLFTVRRGDGRWAQEGAVRFRVGDDPSLEIILTVARSLLQPMKTAAAFVGSVPSNLKVSAKPMKVLSPEVYFDDEATGAPGGSRIVIHTSGTDECRFSVAFVPQELIS